MIRTNAYSILCVFTRTFAMWIFVANVVALPVILNTASQWDPERKWTYFLLGTALPTVVAALVWIFADKLAKLALARPQQIVFESDIATSEWQSVAFSVVGLWQAFAGLVGLTIHLAGILAVVQSQMTSAGMPDSWPPKLVGNVAASVVQLLVGLGLLFGARGLVGLVRRYRQIGYTPTVSTESQHSGEVDGANPDPPPSI